MFFLTTLAMGYFTIKNYIVKGPTKVAEEEEKLKRVDLLTSFMNVEMKSVTRE
jgi:hypothetical protein